jgi:hypothetical protein
MSSIPIEFEKQGLKKTMKKKNKTQKNEQPCTLGDTLILQTMGFFLTFFFNVDQLVFSSK